MAADPDVEVVPSGETASHILIVDDDAAVRDVVSVLLAEEGYVITAAPSAEQAIELVGRGEIHLVISDLKMPGHDGLWLLDQMRKEHPDTSVIMLTGFGDTEAAVECLRRGATDYLLKPPKITDLIRSIERALSRRRIDLARRRYQRRLERKVADKTQELTQALEELEGSYQTTLLALVAALDAREHETSDHSQRVVRFTKAIARIIGFDGRDLGDIGRGALLHDIGKIGVPDSILLKPGPLTKDEWVEMRKHPDIGFQILKGIPFLRTPAEIVLSHQERFDGGGYPRGLKGEEIHIGARIFAIADTFDAITSDRPYRKGQSYDAARAEIERCGSTQFDPDCVKAFLSLDNARLQEIRAAVAQLDA
ncbi:MAG TPA: HD domain-containing phosphohydrolase [Myxococcales bacterium]|jgi:response regulator RpfG family c-di-GMP phosphodiesterase|nr:HD domain-containing phosphohydrolase [Myxococcales bacterium]